MSASRLWFLACVLAAATAARAQEFYGITDNEMLINWNSNDSDRLLLARPLVNVESVVAMDWDPTNPEAGPIALVRDRWLFSIAHLRPPFFEPRYYGGVSAPFDLLGAHFGFEISPVTGNARIVTNAGLNLSIERTKPMAFGTATQLPPLYFAAGDVNEGRSPTVAQIAFGLDGQGHEILYGINGSNGALVRFDSMDGAALHTVAALDIALGPKGGFDIDLSTGYGYLAAESRENGMTVLYKIDLATGQQIGSMPIAGGENLEAFTIAVPEPSALTLCVFGIGAIVALNRRRLGGLVTRRLR